MSSERELLTWEDFLPVRAALDKLVPRLKRIGTKSIYQFLDVDTAMDAITGTGWSYLVGGCYLVHYDVGTPWYAKPGTLILYEKLVLQLAVSGDFTEVPTFLERKAREAGCTLVIAGTALAKSDEALASLYAPSGFLPAALTLIKEL